MSEKNIYEEMGIEPIDPKILEEFDNLPKEKVVLSKKFKRKMNRLFREELGIDRDIIKSNTKEDSRIPLCCFF